MTYDSRNSDPSNDAHPEYWCLQCRAYKTDITRHLVTHNKHPGDMVYCPACLEPMSRNDGKYFVTPTRYLDVVAQQFLKNSREQCYIRENDCIAKPNTCSNHLPATTLPEHILNVHPEVIFGPGPHPLWPLLQQNRIVMMLNTTEAIHLKRLQIDPLRAMIKRDQSALLDAYHGVEHLGELDADDDVDVSQLVNFITGNAAGAVALPVGGNGLATDAAIDGMTARMARSYLQILRVARQTVEAAT